MEKSNKLGGVSAGSAGSGGLYTGTTTPPETKQEVVKGGEVKKKPYNNNNNIGSVCTPFPYMSPTAALTPLRHPNKLYSSDNKVKPLFEMHFERIAPGIGMLQNEYYFGTKIMCSVPVEKKNRKGEVYEVYENQLLTALITSEHRLVYIKDLDHSTICPEITFHKERWELTHISSFLDNISVDKELKDMYLNIKEQFERHIDLQNSSEYTLLALWCLGTYLSPIFDSYPYIHLHGFKNSGKTKVMDLAACMSFNSIQTSCMRPATVFRIIESAKPTLFIDEFETLSEKKKTKDDEEIQLLLNAGYKKSGTVIRNELTANKWIPMEFNVYCPKMLANISGLKGALASRCIKLILFRAKVGDARANRIIKEKDSIWKDIRNDTYNAVLNNWRQVKTKYRTIEISPSISNRDSELWKPLLTLASCCGEEVFEEMEGYALRLIKERRNEEINSNSWEDYLIETLSSMVKENRYYSLHDEIVKNMTDSFFVEEEYFDKFIGDVKKVYSKIKPTSRWVSNVLRKLPNLQYRRVKGKVEVNLNPQMVSKIINRLKGEQAKKEELLGDKE
tara:strand:+ start:5177 stop:6862 length:1686 start_codon:yes stop_codon:yes gene_type:complete